MRRNWIIAGVAAVCFVTRIALSHRIEPGVRIQKVTLAEETPALELLQPEEKMMVELRAARTQAGSDVAQTFAIGQLGKGQTEKLISAGKAADFVIGTIAGDAALKLLGMNPVEQLGQNEFAGVHDRKIAAAPPAAESPDSNRSHYPIEVWPA